MTTESEAPRVWVDCMRFCTQVSNADRPATAVPVVLDWRAATVSLGANTAANRVAQTVDVLLARVMDQQMGQDVAGTLLRNIADDSNAIAGAGFRVAEQAVMALQTFVPLAQKNGKPLRQEPFMKDTIDNLLKSVEQPASYDPQQFATQMRAIHSFLMR